MLDATDACALQLESRSLFWSMLCGSPSTPHARDPIATQHESRKTCLAMLFGVTRRTSGKRDTPNLWKA